jgi:protein tyrosine/serine phosphatase
MAIEQFPCRGLAAPLFGASNREPDALPGLLSPYRRLFRPDRTRFRAPLATAADWRAAWFDALFADFGIIRLWWKNRSEIAPGVFRQNQPTPLDAPFLRRAGIRTIITARHDDRHGGHALMREWAAHEGVDYRLFALFSREAPSREALLSAPAFFETTQKPVLLHCKSGADRAGFLSALYLIVVEDVPVERARRQLSLRFLHFRSSKTGILDAVFSTYLAQTREQPKPFLDWVREDYDPAAITRAFRPSFLGEALDRWLLRRE